MNDGGMLLVAVTLKNNVGQCYRIRIGLYLCVDDVLLVFPAAVLGQGQDTVNEIDRHIHLVLHLVEGVEIQHPSRRDRFGLPICRQELVRVPDGDHIQERKFEVLLLFYCELETCIVFVELLEEFFHFVR